jgi:hypothetical protein
MSDLVFFLIPGAVLALFVPGEFLLYRAEKEYRLRDLHFELRGLIDQAMAEGWTFEEFHARADNIMKKRPHA